MEVQLKGISKVFQNKQRAVTAVDDLSVTIPSGTLVGLLGPSGCGKSTTLFMLAGVHDCSAGEIYFDKECVTKYSPGQRNVGMVFQNYALYPHLSVKENIAFPLVNSKKMKQQLKMEWEKEKGNISFKQYIEKRVLEAAQLVEIIEYLERKPTELSGGQQQRVAIARALVKRPSLLLLDEPLSNLDARLRIQTREEIRRIQKETGITTIFVTHDQEEAMNICDQIIVMKEGRLQQQGEPQKVYDRPDNCFVASFLGNPPINLLHAQIVNGNIRIGKDILHPGTKMTDQGEVIAGIRAENLRVVSEETKDTLAGDVIAVEKLGGATTVTVKLNNGDKVKLFHDIHHPVQMGDTIRITTVPEGMCVFNEKGEKLLQW